MRRIAQISDLHFGCTNAAVVEGLIVELEREKPDLIIASGDFTMAARRSEYVQAQAFMARLPKPWIGVPGNHDISPYHLMQRFVRPFGRYRHYIADETEPTYEDSEIGVVCLNTVRTWAPERDWSQGMIRRRQITTAAARLAAMPTGLFKIVVAHHPFLPPPWDEQARLVGRSDQALATFQRCGVGLVLGGHLHRHYARFVRDYEPSQERTDPDSSGVRGDTGHLLAAQAGSATSTRLRGDEANAYNSIVVEGGSAIVTVRVWNGNGWNAADPERRSSQAR